MEIDIKHTSKNMKKQIKQKEIVIDRPLLVGYSYIILDCTLWWIWRKTCGGFLHCPYLRIPSGHTDRWYLYRMFVEKNRVRHCAAL